MDTTELRLAQLINITVQGIVSVHTGTRSQYSLPTAHMLLGAK